MGYVKKERKPSTVQMDILRLCSSPTHFEKVTVEDQARRLMKRELLQRVEGPICWRRYYKTTEKGEAVIFKALSIIERA